jgi:hypothetical protein
MAVSADAVALVVNPMEINDGHFTSVTLVIFWMRMGDRPIDNVDDTEVDICERSKSRAGPV